MDHHFGIVSAQWEWQSANLCAIIIATYSIPNGFLLFN
jgi:hypothetical protein